jgi:UDP:flavonoid glycosyltransferase YjiC (YdhE family)
MSRAGDLDQGRKIVLVTQGTVANHDFDLLIRPTTKALTQDSDLLVVVTTGGRGLDSIPWLLPDNVRVAQYLPFEWLLPKVDVLVTNGGDRTVNQALSHGTPILGPVIDLRTNNPTREDIRTDVRQIRYG